MTLSSPARPGFARLLAATGCAAAVSLGMAFAPLAPAIAQNSAPPERLTPAQKEKIFPEIKALTLKQQKETEKLQQKAQRCTTSAATPKALSECRKEQRQAQQELRRQMREEKSKIYARNGIKAPVGGPGKGKKGTKAGPDA